MKKIFFYIAIFFAIFSFNFSNTFAYNDFDLAKAANSALFNNTPTVPYCPPGASECGLDKWIEQSKEWIDWIKKDWDFASYLQEIILYVLWFLFFVTVVIIIWAWVVILTSAWNDDKVENAKKIIINCIIWLIVIFLAYPIARFIIWIFDQA